MGTLKSLNLLFLPKYRNFICDKYIIIQFIHHNIAQYKLLLQAHDCLNTSTIVSF